MKILFITHYFAPDSGAAPNRLTRLARMLQQKGHDVTVLTTHPHYPTGEISPGYRRRFSVVDDVHGVRVIHIWLWASSHKHIMARVLSQLSFMVMLMLRGIFVQKPDAILIESQPIFTALAGWFISKIKRTPYVLNISDYWPEYLVIAGVTSETSLTYRVFRQLAIQTQRDAAQIAVMWDGLRDGVHKRLQNPPPVTLIYNATDLDRFRPTVDDREFRTKYKLGDKRWITFLGVMGNHLDIDTMLQVARQLGELEQPVGVLFVGTGSQVGQVQAVLDDPAYSHLRWIEWLDYSEVDGFWATSHITYWAMQDNPLDKLRLQAKLFEILASGVPSVIAIADGLMSQLLNDHAMGVAVAPNDAEALFAAILRLLNDSDLYQQTSINARHYAEEHFDPQKTTDAYERLLLATQNVED